MYMCYKCAYKCHLSGHECNKFEHDLCPRLEKVFLSKFLTCYLSITFKSLPEAAMNKNIHKREQQLHSLTGERVGERQLHAY